MDKKEEQFANFTEAMTVVALRKTEFFNRIWSLVGEKIPSEFTEYNKQQLKDSFVRVISQMDNRLFLSEAELRSKKINSTQSLMQIGFDQSKLVNEFYRALRMEYPNLKI